MAEYQGGLRRWFKEQWVDISRPKPGGGYAACGRPTDGMTSREYQRKSAVQRKRTAESKVARDGKKPIMVSTFKKYKGIADEVIYKNE